MSHALALHEDFVKTCLEWLVPLGLVTRSQLRDVRTVNVHERMEAVSGVPMDPDSLALFHLTRLMRNCHIHAGGVGSRELERHSRGLTQVQRETWQQLTKEPFSELTEGATVQVGVGGLIATLAIGKRLAYDVNLALQAAIPREEWAVMAAREYFALGAKRPTHATALRSLVGYSRGTYAALGLREEELASAIERLRQE